MIGGKASEYNTISLLEYAGVDLDNDDDLRLAYHLLSFYCGARIIELIDNGYGITSMLRNPNSKSYQLGESTDTDSIMNVLTKLQQNLIDTLIVGSEAYDVEKVRIVNLP